MNLIFNRPVTPEEYQDDEPENNCAGEGMPHLVNDHVSYCAGNERRCKGCGVIVCEMHRQDRLCLACMAFEQSQIITAA